MLVADATAGIKKLGVAILGALLDAAPGMNGFGPLPGAAVAGGMPGIKGLLVVVPLAWVPVAMTLT